MSRLIRMGLMCAVFGLAPMMAKAEDPGGGPLKLTATAEDQTTEQEPGSPSFDESGVPVGEVVADVAGDEVMTDDELAAATREARERREAAEGGGHEGGDLTPVAYLEHHIGQIENTVNHAFRSGGDAVIELHQATGRLRAAIRQLALIEAAALPQAV